MQNQNPFPSKAYNKIARQHRTVSTSTNSELREMIEHGHINTAQPFLLTASEQTAGRGQHKRTWQSPKGNVYLSLYHPLDVTLSGLLSLVVGYQLTRLPLIQDINRSRQLVNLPTIGVKWANDVGFYAPNPSSQECKSLIFNKLAGILIEPIAINNQIIGVIVGVGMNIAMTPKLNTDQQSMVSQAISLHQLITDANHNAEEIKTKSSLATQPLPQAQDLYLPISTAVINAIAKFSNFQQMPYTQVQFINDYNQVNALLDKKITIDTKPSHHSNTFKDSKLGNDTTNGQYLSAYHGTVSGINPDGSLKLQTYDAGESKTIAIYTGTLTVIGDSAT